VEASGPGRALGFQVGNKDGWKLDNHGLITSINMDAL
jgi:hypothetical protein